MGEERRMLPELSDPQEYTVSPQTSQGHTGGALGQDTVLPSPQDLLCPSGASGSFSRYCLKEPTQVNPRKTLSGNGPSPVTVLLFPFSFHLSLISFFLKDLILFQLTAESFGPSRHMCSSLSLLRLREVGEFIFPKVGYLQFSW